MLHRFPFKAPQGCNNSLRSSSSSSSISNPMTSSAEASSRLVSSTSANNDPLQQSPHPVHRLFVRLGFMLGSQYTPFSFMVVHELISTLAPKPRRRGAVGPIQTSL